MALTKQNAGSYGWLGLGAFVFGFDFLAHAFKFEMLTDSWRRWLTHPSKRWLVGASWLLTTKHLFFGNYLPWLDPFHIIGVSFKLIDPFLRS